MGQNNQRKPADKEPSSSHNPSPKNSWVWIYFLSLILLLFLGTMVKQYVPLFEFYIESAETIPYEEVAPGWASSKPVRSVLEPWLRWDTVWYLKVAKNGYQPASPENIFPPLYPLFVRVLGRTLGGQYLIASLLISWGAFFGACYLLNERIEQHYPDIQSRSGIWNMVFFPTAFFFFASYTESLFLLLVLLAWRYADRKNWLTANLLGSVLVLAKFFGLFLVFPFGYMWWKNKTYKNSPLSALSFLLLPITYFSWTEYSKFRFGMSPSEVLANFWPGHFDLPWAGLLCNAYELFTQPILLQLDFIANLIAVSATLWALYWWFKRRSFPEFLFMGSIFLFSMMQISDHICMVSTSRHVLTLFPVFLAQPSFLKNNIPEKIFQLGQVLVWMFFSSLYFAGLWIA
jgi:hypothetical protein